MDNTAQVLHKTTLSDREVWFDGTVAYHPSAVVNLLKEGVEVRAVTSPSDAVTQYNKFASPDKRIRVKTELVPFAVDWTFDQRYKSLDVSKYVHRLHEQLMGKEANYSERVMRLDHELQLFADRGLFDVIRAIIFTINRLTLADAVWGIGRGSSVSSYVLFVIGAHDVDSHEYDIPVEDFLREEEE